MLDMLRKNSRSFLIYLMFAVIIVVFMFTFGAITPDQACGGGGPGTAVPLAEVDGTPISTPHLYLADSLSISPPSPSNTDARAQGKLQLYQITRYGLSSYQVDEGSPQGRWSYAPIILSQYRDYGIDPSKVSPIKIDKIMNNLIETRLVANHARSLGMAVTTKQLNKELYFLTSQFTNEETGVFDSEGWEGWVRGMGATPSGFEAFVEDEILRARFIGLLVGGITVSDDELDFLHRAQNEKASLEYVSVDKVSAKPLVPLTDDEVKTWLTANQGKVTEYYDKNKDAEFSKPKRWTLRGIKLNAPNRLSVPKDADEAEKTKLAADREAVKTKADTVLADFTAKLTPAAPAPTPAPAPEDGAAPPAPAPAPTPSVDAVAVFSEAAKANSDDASAATGGLLPKEYSEKDLGRYPFGPEVAAAVAGLEKGAVSGVIEVDSGFWIVRAEGIMEAETTTLEQAQVGIARSLLADEKVDAFKKTLADEVLAEAKKLGAEGTLDDVAKALNTKYAAPEGKGLSARTTAPFGRVSGIDIGYIGGVGTSPDLLRDAFAQDPEAPALLEQVYETDPGNKLIVARVTDREPAPEPDAEEQEALRQALNEERRQSFYRSWYQDLRASKENAGDISFTGAWKQLLSDAVTAYQSAGGTLPQTADAAIPPQ